MPKVLVLGATGVTGTAIVRYFSSLPDWTVTAVARRDPWIFHDGVTHVRADLTNAGECRDVFGAMTDVTHIVYAAVNENEADIVAGWDDPAQADINVQMLRNLLGPFTDGAPNAFRHITLVHGMKAYGSHLPHITTKLPFKETDATYEQLNFYHHQQALVSQSASGAQWGWTVLRPNGTIGAAIGGNMNWSLLLMVFAALCAEAGEKMPLPSGDSPLIEMTDADLIAAACEWAALAPAARNQVFNLTNGDVFACHDVYPILARAFGIALADPRPFAITHEFERLAPLWPAIVDKHGLRAPRDLSRLLGATPQIVGGWSAELPPERKLMSGLSSTIKIRQAGFDRCADSNATFEKYIERNRELGILPPPS